MSSLSGFGEEYERRVSENVAKKLLNGREIPRKGYEACVAKVPGYHSGFHCRLMVQNISGTLVAASADTPAVNWKEVFGVEIA